MAMIETMMMALGAILPAARRAAEDHELVLEHIARSERELKALGEELEAVRSERDAWRARCDALIAASHRCQHQAQWSRAMVNQLNAFDAQAQQGLYGGALRDALNPLCRRALADCNLHQAERQKQGS